MKNQKKETEGVGVEPKTKEKKPIESKDQIENATWQQENQRSSKNTTWQQDNCEALTRMLVRSTHRIKLMQREVKENIILIQKYVGYYSR